MAVVMPMVVLVVMAVIVVVVMRVAVIVSLVPMAVISVGVIVVMLMTVVMVCMPVVVRVLVMRVIVSLLGLFLNDLVGFEQSNAQQQGQRHIPFNRVQEASIGFDLAEHPFQFLKAFWRNQVTFVEHQDVAVEHLSSPHLGIEDLFAKVFGIDHGDDRVQPRFIAQITCLLYTSPSPRDPE